MTDKRVVFMGTPDFAVPVLKMLIENTNLLLIFLSFNQIELEKIMKK